MAAACSFCESNFRKELGIPSDFDQTYSIESLYLYHFFNKYVEEGAKHPDLELENSIAVIERGDAWRANSWLAKSDAVRKRMLGFRSQYETQTKPDITPPDTRNFIDERRGSPDPAFVGDFLAMNFAFEPHFGLSKADLDNLVAPFNDQYTASIREPAKFWIVLYLCWVYKTNIQSKYGDDLLEKSLQATSARFAKLEETASFGNNLKFYFEQFDHELAQVGQTINGKKIQATHVEYLIALKLLALSPDSPLCQNPEFDRLAFLRRDIVADTTIISEAKQRDLQRVQKETLGALNDFTIEVAMSLSAVFKTAKEHVLPAIQSQVYVGGPAYWKQS